MKVTANYHELKDISDLNIVLDKSDHISIRIGNTVVDISSGYKAERGFIDIYPYENEKPYGFVINDNQRAGVCWRDGQQTSY